MSNEEFLRRLEAALQGRVPQEDVDDAMNYHREYFAEAGENAAAELPAPEAVAEQIIREREEYLRKRQFKWAKPAVIGALCVGLVVTAIVSWGTKMFFGNFWGRRVQYPFVTTDVITQVVEEAYAGTALTTTETGDRITVCGTLEAFESIVIEGVSDSVIITPGNDFTLDMYHSKKESVDCAVQGDTLYITGEMKGFFSTGFKGGNIAITVPTGTELSAIRVEADLGEITLSGITAGEVELDADVGAINVSDGTFRYLDCDSDMGEVTVTGVTAECLKCYCDAGQVTAIDFTAQETELEADMGSVTAVALGARSDYSLELEVDLGEIKVDGQKVANPYSAYGESKVLKAKADVGSITLDFAGTSTVPSPPDPPSPPEAPSLSSIFGR